MELDDVVYVKVVIGEVPNDYTDEWDDLIKPAVLEALGWTDNDTEMIIAYVYNGNSTYSVIDDITGEELEAGFFNINWVKVRNQLEVI